MVSQRVIPRLVARARPHTVAQRLGDASTSSPTRRSLSNRALDDERLGALDAVMGVTRVPSSESVDDASSAAAAAARRTVRECTVELTEDTAARLELEVSSASARLIRATMRSPLGIVFEEIEGEITVVEFFDQSDTLGPISKGIKIGDVLRATSAMTREMSYGKLGILGGGNGRPTWKRVMYTVAYGTDELDDVTFDQAMKAIGSNAKAGDFDVELVFERRMS